MLNQKCPFLMSGYKDKSNSMQSGESQAESYWMKVLLGFLCTIMLCCSFACAKAKDSSLAAHYTFDEGAGTILHDKSGNGNDGKIVGPGWVKGKSGAALDFDGADLVDLGDSPSLHPSGPITLAVWFKTVSDEQQFILSYYGWNIYLIPGLTPILETLLEGRWQGMGALNKVALNKWSFIAVTYDPERQVQEIYVNGKLSNSQPRTERPWVPGQHWRGKIYLSGRGFSGLIGDARIYTRALSPEEIEKVYQEYTIDESLESTQYRFQMKPHLLFRQQEIDLELSMTGPRKASSEPIKPLGAFVTEVTLHKAGKKKILQQQTIDNLAEIKKTNITLSLKDLKPGDYEIRASAKYPDGTLLAQESASVKYPEKPWWFDTQAGKGLYDKVFAPFTPLKVDSIAESALQMKVEGVHSKPTRVECWGRTYEFRTGTFPQQIITAERAILAEPIRLTARADGCDISWKDTIVRLKKETPAKVTLSHKALDPKLKLTADIQIEYDGMIRTDFKVTALRKCTLESLTFEMPLRKEHATLQYQCRDRLFKAPGAVPPEGIVRGFNQAIWLGDEERGIQWFTESDQYWHLADQDKSIEIMPEGDKVVLRINLITKPLELEPGKTDVLSYTFGLQATPVKPADKDCWDYRWTSAHRYGGDYSMLTEKIDGEPVLDYYARLGVKTIHLGNWTDAMSYPLPYKHDEEFRKLVKAIHKREMKVLVYYGAQYSEIAPDFDSFKNDFLGSSTTTTPYSYSGYPDNYPGIPTQMVYGPCIRSDWADLMIAGAARLIDEYDVDGIFFDNNGCIVGSGCMNTNHPGCGELTRLDGSKTRAFSVFDGRDFARRLYHVVKSRKPDGLMEIHGASFVTTASMAWATGNWDGETILGEDRMGGNPQKGDFILNYLPLDGFRAQFMGKNWGIPAAFVDYYVPYPYEKQYALTLLHDVPIRAHVSPEKLKFQSSIWRVMDEFGRTESEWLPYWKNSEYVTAGPEGAYVSMYKHPKNGVLTVVSNLGEEKAQVTVDFALDKLGLTDKCTAIDAFTAEPISIKKGKITMDLDTVDWRFVWLKH